MGEQFGYSRLSGHHKLMFMGSVEVLLSLSGPRQELCHALVSLQAEVIRVGAVEQANKTASFYTVIVTTPRPAPLPF